MVKLTDLKGAENLPVKSPEDKYGHSCYDGEPCGQCIVDGENGIIDQYNSLSIDGDVEALIKIITSEYYPRDERAALLAIQIIANLDKFLVIRER